MTDRIYIKNTGDGLLQWRVRDSQGRWLTDECSTGDVDALKEGLPNSAIPVTLILSGADVVSCEVPVADVDKKHLGKLLPFELEERIITPIEDVHLSYSDVVDGQVTVHYIDAGKLAMVLEPLAEMGCEVTEAIPDFSLLQSKADTLSLIECDGGVIVLVGDQQRMTLDANMAKVILPRLELDYDKVTRLNIVASTDENIEALHELVPELWQDDFEITVEEKSYWDCLSAAQVKAPSKLNLRRGRFARQLPFERWAKIWQLPAMAILLVFIVSVSATYGEYLKEKSQQKAIRQQIVDVYLDAVPNGKRGDEERRLKTLLSGGNKKTTEPTNFMPLLSQVATVMKNFETVQMSNFRYNGDRKELQANIEIESLAELNRFKEKLEAQGLNVGSPRSSAQGDIYQARMTITENAQ